MPCLFWKEGIEREKGDKQASGMNIWGCWIRARAKGAATGVAVSPTIMGKRWRDVSEQERVSQAGTSTTRLLGRKQKVASPLDLGFFRKGALPLAGMDREVLG